MSAAAAATPADAGGAKPAKKSKKKLIIIIAAVLVLVLGGGGAAMVLMKKKAPAGEDGDESSAPAAAEHKAEHKIDPKHPPTFVALEPFVVNLADKEAERYAQIGITLEVADEKFGESMKAFMPAIRNGILMILAHKSSAELQGRAGKEKLAGQIQREAGRTMGLDIEEPDPEDEAGDDKVAKDAEDEAPKSKAKSKKKKKKPAAPDNPIRHVLFSNFIIQ